MTDDFLSPAVPENDPGSTGTSAPASSLAVILLANDGMAGLAGSAVATAGGRVVARHDWSAPFAVATAGALHPVVMVETQGVADSVLAEVLPTIDAAAGAAGLHMVVTLDPEGIDVVAGAMLGRDVQLLCLPMMAERVAALVVAGEAANASHVSGGLVRENEAERLRRLNEEVARIAEVLARLTHAAEPSAQEQRAEDRRVAFGHEPAPTGGTVEAADVRRAIRARRLRDTYFSGGLFEDPAWDMLLDLFAAELEGTQVSVSSLCIAAAVAPTTALRWIGKLTQADLLERRPDPVDRRRAFMALTPRASETMRGYIGALQRSGLSLA